MLKHIRNILAGIRELDPSISVSLLRTRTHINFRVTAPDGRKHRITVSSSPKDPDIAERRTLNEVRALIADQREKT